MLTSIVWENQKLVQYQHNSLKILSRKLFNLKNNNLEPSLSLHLLHLSALEKFFACRLRRLHDGIVSLENCAEESNKFKMQIIQLNCQMKFLQSQCIQHQCSLTYTMKHNRIVSDEGLTGSSVVGVWPAEEKAIQEEIEGPGTHHERIVREWGFNFNDSPFEKKWNLYHVIYTGEHEDYLYMDLRNP